MRSAVIMLIIAALIAGCTGSPTNVPPMQRPAESGCPVTAQGITEQFCVYASPTPGPTYGWTYAFSFYPTSYNTRTYTPTLYSSWFPLTGPSIILTDPYCTYQVGHDAVADATILYAAIRNAQGVWGTASNAAQIRNLLGGFNNSYTGGWTIPAAVEFIVGALSLLGPGDLALIVAGTGLTAYSLYKVIKCESGK